LLPYYRLYAPYLYQTKFEESPIKIIGGYKLNTYLKSYLCIEENTYIVASADQKVYLMRILEEGKKNIELSKPLNKINKLITYMASQKKGNIIVFSVTGDIYVLRSNNFSDVFENLNNLEIIKLENDLVGFENIHSIDENKFLCQINRSEFVVLEIDANKLSLEVKKYIDLSRYAYEINSMTKISNDKFALGSNKGDLIIANYENDLLLVDQKVNLLNEPIRYIGMLENESKEKNICACLGSSGIFSLYDYKSSSSFSLENKDSLAGVYDLTSIGGSAILLTDYFSCYLLEENMGKWILSKGLSPTNNMYVNIICLSPSSYLLIDIDGNFYSLEVDRLDCIEKLRNINFDENRGFYV
ncbi:MAG: hypothetical protein ACLUJE_08220, partial [Anaerococcus sp.]